MIYFEVEGVGYAVKAADLSGVANHCPSVNYPGLPDGVEAITQWSGKIFPIISLCKALGLGEPSSLDECTYLFSLENQGGPYPEFALAVPGSVRVFFARQFEERRGHARFIGAVARDAEGIEAFVIAVGELGVSFQREGKLAA